MQIESAHKIALAVLVHWKLTTYSSTRVVIEEKLLLFRLPYSVPPLDRSTRYIKWVNGDTAGVRPKHKHACMPSEVLKASKQSINQISSARIRKDQELFKLPALQVLG